MKYFSALLIPAVLSLSGCTNLFPKPEQFTPPSESSDVAKIRLIGPPMSYALYQTDSSGKKTGGWILKHNAYLNPFLGSTKDIGLPKITGKKYKDDYVETLLVPDEKTIIHHSLYQGCHVNLPFVPEKKKIYEAHISYGDKTGYCVLYLKEVVLDSENGIYVEKELSK